MPALPRHRVSPRPVPGALMALTLAVAGLPLLAHAQGGQAGPGLTPGSAPVPEPVAWFDLYGTSAKLDTSNTNGSDGEASQIGGGLAGHVTFGSQPRPVRFTLDGSAQHNEFDTQNLDLDQFRLGPGLEFNLPAARLTAASPRFFAKLEVIDWRIDDKANSNTVNAVGGGVHVGVRKPFANLAAVYAQVGYLRLEDTNSDGFIEGPEVKAGFDIVPTPDLARNARVFAEYRYTGTRQHAGSQSADLHLGDIRVGIRIGFGDYRYGYGR